MMLESLINPEDEIINKIYKTIENESNNKEFRTYLGASSIGDKCERKLYYRLRHPQEASMPRAELTLAANDGNRSEIIVAQMLQKAGVDLLVFDETTGEQLGFKDNNFAGHIDGLIRNFIKGEEWTIWENKCTNEKKFNELVKIKESNPLLEVLEKWDYTYYCQAVVYMHYFKCNYHYTTVASAGTRKLESIITKSNKELAEILIEKARRILDSTMPPFGISDNKAFYLCKMCEFQDFCHGN